METSEGASMYSVQLQAKSGRLQAAANGHYEWQMNKRNERIGDTQNGDN